MTGVDTALELPLQRRITPAVLDRFGELTKIASSLSNHTHVAEVDVRELAV